MAQFIGDIAFLFELGLVAVGIVLIHFGRERSAGMLRTAGWILVIGALGTAICTSVFWFRYLQAGDFDRAEAAPFVEFDHDLDSPGIALLG